MQFQQLLNDWWPLIVVVSPLALLLFVPPFIRTVALLMALGVIISILRKQNEQKKTAEPKPVQPQGSAA